jgi:hypothetical protein
LILAIIFVSSEGNNREKTNGEGRKNAEKQLRGNKTNA